MHAVFYVFVTTVRPCGVVSLVMCLSIAVTGSNVEGGKKGNSLLLKLLQNKVVFLFKKIQIINLVSF